MEREKKVQSVVLDVLQKKKGKIKIPLRRGCFDIPGWSVWVLQGHGGGGTRVRTAVEGFGGESNGREKHNTKLH